MPVVRRDAGRVGAGASAAGAMSVFAQEKAYVRRIEKLFTTLNRQLGLTLLITSHHIPSSLRMADQIVFLLDGTAISGSPKDLRHHADPRIAGFFAAELEADAEGDDA